MTTTFSQNIRAELHTSTKKIVDEKLEEVSSLGNNNLKLKGRVSEMLF